MSLLLMIVKKYIINEEREKKGLIIVVVVGAPLIMEHWNVRDKLFEYSPNNHAKIQKYV